MKNERILTPTAFALVAFLHVGLVFLLWQNNRPVPMEMEHIEFVDLGGGDGMAEGAGAPAPEAESVPKAEPETPKPKAEPKPRRHPQEPVKRSKPELKPVITQKAQADMRQEKETPKTKPVEKPKPEPVEKTQPEEKPVEKAVERAAEAPAEKPAEPAGYRKKIMAKDGAGDGSGYAKIQGKGSGSGSGEGRGTGSGSRSGEGGGSGAGSSRSNPVKATCRVPLPTDKDYPIQAAELGEEGVVGFVMEVSPDNQIASVRVVKSSGSSRLDRAAVKFVKKYPCDSKGKWQQFSGQIVYRL